MNRIERISLSGGLIGLLTTNPRRALDNALDRANADGWEAVQVIPHRTTNALVFAAQLTVLLLTCGLWTWGAGYLVLLRK